MRDKETPAERLKNAAKLRADDVREELPGEALVQLSDEDFGKIVEMVQSKFQEQLDSANDRIEQMAIQLEKKDAERHLKHKGQFTDKNLVIRPVRFGPPDHLSNLVKTAKETHDFAGKHIRFVNNDQNIRSLRRAQGYDPVVDENGNEYRYMDEVLMTIPQGKYQAEIKQPTEDRKRFNRQGIAESFRETAEGLGVEATGDITYDEQTGGAEISESEEVYEVAGAVEKKS